MSLLEWAKWFEDFRNRVIDRTDISNLPHYPGGDFVSTVFLGIDHNFDPFQDWKEHVPVLFETMVFGGEYDNRGWRWSGYGEAKRGHWQIVDCIKAGRPPEANTGHRPFIELFLEMLRDEPEPEQPGDEGDAPDPGEPE